ncbi:MAG: ATP-dependent helicase, partial [Patescibacteria group bacterium]
MQDILANLNDEQRAAVTHTEGPLMMIAGAGTGKTTVMTRRMGWLIARGLAKPDEILALTFTDKAAAEMEERVDRLLPYGYVDLWISTFHAFCQRVLEEHGLDIGLPHRPRVFTDVDAWVMLREEIDCLPLNYYKPLGNPTKFLHAFLAHVSRLKDEGLTPEAYRLWLNNHAVDDAEEQRRRLELAETYAVYEQRLLDRGATDFGGLILSTLRLFRERPNILAAYQKRFKAMMVDEFQDTNRAQYDLIKLLAGAQGNIAVVGDDDQGIYRFRGASVENILRFNREYPHARRIVLTKNYRSVQPVLDAAYAFIARNNPHRLEVALKESHGLSKQLESQRGGEGGVEHVHAATVQEEASMVASKILDLKRTAGCDWKDVAVLVRANDHAEPFLQAFAAAGIPFRFLAMSGLYRQPVILDAVALLRLINQPLHSPSGYRILSHPTIGIAPNDLALLSHTAHKAGVPLLRTVDVSDGALSNDATRRIRELSSMLDELRGEATRRNALEVFARAVNVSGLHAAVLQENEAEQVRLFSLLNQFVERLRRFIQTARHPGVHEFLLALEEEQQAGEEGALSTDDQASPDE